MIKIDGTNFWMSLVRTQFSRRIRHHGLDLLRYFLPGIREINTVAITFAHLAAVEPRHLRHMREHRLRLREDLLLLEMEEPTNDLTSQF